MRLDTHRREDGFTLVELLVVITLTTIVGAIALSGFVQGLRTNERAQSRINAFNELQLSVERVARELRAADPVIGGFSADEITVRIFRQGACRHFTVRLEGYDLVMEREESSDGCATFGPVLRQVVARDVRGGAQNSVDPFVPGSRIFSYANNQGGTPLTVNDIRRIRLTLTHDLPQQNAVTVSTVVNVRNNR